jgi:beta-lactamase class A
MCTRAETLFAAAAVLWAGAAPVGGQSLHDRLQPLIDAHHGKTAVAVEHLESGESFSYRIDEPQATASLIKLAVMVEAYRQQAEGRLDLGQAVVLSEGDKVPGSGILTPHFSPGTSLSLRDCIRLMMAFSDNTSTNLLLDRIGIKSTSDTMERLGFPNTKIHSKVFRRDTSVNPERSERFGLGSTTAGEMLGLLKALHGRSLLSSEASDAMLEHLKACDDKLKFPRFLPAGTVVAFKTGSVSAARTAAGILYAPGGPVAVVVLTEENVDTSWGDHNQGDLLCASVAREVHDRFRSRPAEQREDKD